MASLAKHENIGRVLSELRILVIRENVMALYLSLLGGCAAVLTDVSTS